jgi:hypothetical protein
MPNRIGYHWLGLALRRTLLLLSFKYREFGTSRSQRAVPHPLLLPPCCYTSAGYFSSVGCTVLEDKWPKRSIDPFRWKKTTRTDDHLIDRTPVHTSRDISVCLQLLRDRWSRDKFFIHLYQVNYSMLKLYTKCYSTYVSTDCNTVWVND